MNSDMLLNRIRMAQQGLIGVHKKLYTLEHLLPSRTRRNLQKPPKAPLC